MTLIVTIVSEWGRIQASDSFVTSSDPSMPTRSDRKVFPLGFIDGALALAGTYRVGRSERMDTWMPRLIEDYALTEDPSLSGFAEYLKDRLDAELTDDQRLTMATLVHIAGYVHDDKGAHPEFYFVRNTDSIDPTSGSYGPSQYNFRVDEHFWTRDYEGSMGSRAAYWRYFNGTPDGRIASALFDGAFHEFLKRVWLEPTWHFRPPSSLQDLASIVDIEIRTIGALYAMSDYPARFIGGEPQIELTQPPVEAIQLWAGAELPSRCDAGREQPRRRRGMIDLLTPTTIAGAGCPEH